MARALIQGDGIAAICCEHLLKKAGFSVTTQALDRRRLPAIMLSDAALGLIRDVFEQGNLFEGLPRIQKRVVAWGRNAEPVTLKHSAVVVSEEFLLASLRSPAAVAIEDHGADWTVFTSRPLPTEASEHPFGSRIARISQVTLKGDPATCWIESLENGWLFLIPHSETGGWLLSIGAAELAESRLIGLQIARIDCITGEFPAYPRVMSPLCGPGWVACGTAAMAFDPLCGDGTANAVREAILAAAVIQAASNGGDSDSLFRHYEARLTAGFQKHLALSTGFYQTGHQGNWWESELAALQHGLDWCAGREPQLGEFRYRLNGFALEAVT